MHLPGRPAELGGAAVLLVCAASVCEGDVVSVEIVEESVAAALDDVSAALVIEVTKEDVAASRVEVMTAMIDVSTRSPVEAVEISLAPADRMLARAEDAET